MAAKSKSTEKSKKQKKPRVGMIGAGAMGLPMTGHLLKAGFAVGIFDISKKARTAAAKIGAAVHSSAREVAANTDVILVIVPADDDVRAACLGDDGVFAGAGRGAVVAICASIMPETATALAADAPTGVGVIDSSMTEGIQGAIEGNMTMLVGGAARDAAKARPVFEAFSDAVHHVGPLGAGAIAKTVNNMVIWATMLAVKEGLEFGAKYDVSAKDMRTALLDCSAQSWVLEEFPHIVPTWPRKDLDTCLQLADAKKMHMPIAGLSRGMLTHISAKDFKDVMKLK